MGQQSRRDPRYNVVVGASFRNGTATRNLVKVSNISARGCRFSSAHALEMGSPIVLTFGSAAALDARVRWRVGKAHGVRFAAPLHPAELDHIRLFLSEEPAFVAEREPMSA